MSIKLKGSSDGSVSFDAPADTSPSGSDITLTLPTSAGSANQFLKNSGIAGELEYSSMVETSTGVGIGTSSPIGKLAVSDGTVTGEINPFSSSSTCFIGTRTNHNVSFQINASEKARIDTSGRLLVGSSSNLAPDGFASKIQTAGTDYQGGSISIRRDQNSSSGPSLLFTKSRSSVLGGTTIVQSGDLIGQVAFYGADGGDVNQAAGWIRCFVDGTPGGNDMPGRLEFHTTADGAASPTERMRIGSGGMISALADAGWESQILYNKNGAGSVRSFIIGRHSATALTGVSGTIGTVSFKVTTNGNVTNTNNSYGSISDAKLKENIVDASSQWDDIKDLRVRNYNFIEGETHTQIGVVAQEVETVSPGLVTESPDTDEEGNDLGTVTKSVNYSVLYMKAIKALQEAQTRIETLESQHADLLARVTALEAA